MTRLLLVEDNEENRDGLSRRLCRKGFAVLLAVDGRQGIESARTRAPDLILMDMSLPVLDGWEATRLLKSDPATSHIPVIALTAHAMAGDRAKALEAGCDDYDTKPVEFTRLLAKIQALLGKQEGLRPGEPGEEGAPGEPPDQARGSRLCQSGGRSPESGKEPPRPSDVALMVLPEPLSQNSFLGR
jgi:two-component system cell cycle response regulator DivK